MSTLCGLLGKICLSSQGVLMQAGALVAGVVFALTSDQGKFYISAACGLAGVLCTFLFIPDITGLDLREGDRRWIKNVEGKGMLSRHCCTWLQIRPTGNCFEVITLCSCTLHEEKSSGALQQYTY